MRLKIVFLEALVLLSITKASFLRSPTQDESLTGRPESPITEPTYSIVNLTVGYLTAIRGTHKDRQGLSISGAFTIALEEINNDPNILPNVTLTLRWKDTEGDTVKAIDAMNDMMSEGVAVFFGPEGHCYDEALVAQAKNIPMISYKCFDEKALNISTFATTEPRDTVVVKYLISLLTYYDWKKFSIIHEEAWYTVASSLADQAKRLNMTINDKRSVVDRHKCCEQRLSCCLSNYWYQLIQETKDRTRIYVFLGSSLLLVEFMHAMQATHLFDEGEYMVIYADKNIYSPDVAYKYLWKPDTLERGQSCEKHQSNFLKMGRSLFVVLPSAPLQGYYKFTERVREYNAREPFSFPGPSLLQFHRRFVSIYAAYLYDAVKLYARALHKLLTEHAILTKEIIEEVASNGTKIIETIAGMKSYESISGLTMHLDKNGDSTGNFTVLALRKINNKNDTEIVRGFTCDYHLQPVGSFWNKNFPMYVVTAGVEWPGVAKPDAELPCGFKK